MIRIPEDVKPDPDQNPTLNITGFTTNKGLMLDLDSTTYRETLKIAIHYCKRFNLQGYLIIKSSENNYHIVFNRYLKWSTIIEYLFKIVWSYHYHEHGIKPKLTNWAILQAIKHSETLRISEKRIENKKVKTKPKLLITRGKTDRLISDYLNIYYTIKPIQIKKQATQK